MSKIPEMTASERFKAYLSGKEVDRAPAVEWAPWWHLTVNRWLEDGLPRDAAGYEQLQGYFGLDKCLQTSVTAKTGATPNPPTYGLGIMDDEDDYETKVKPTLFPSPESVISEEHYSF